ncbi:SSS sodium solute transporter superfamily [Rubrobacter xylanophilus DSM 9941]|uniref:SSS sodium solute transporter superfamily n=1 Tax=Rubrobacter xylanophilus (strain DSM 9941 / JCM 11954 / NBRC 16129 / PRD-1) TaxID=266117 RepID=Q1AZQ6_RUBXD|nr:cation acetate symporter [Rubrobacter xylanophilus]ABG03122.1 SSS sodium solute transporter superfamily [Rubrobacter xylanophilus DSM 9941]
MSDRAIATIFFVLIIVLTLGITAWAARRNKDTAHHYVAGGEIKGWQNGLAISGDYLSAASFLGIAGSIALTGFSGFYLSIGFLVAYLVVLLLVAEPLRNLGKYTFADMLAARFNLRSVRSAAALSTIAISTFYMIAQMVGAGALIELLLGLPYVASVVIIGVLMTIYIAAGGMVATTWIQIVKAVLLISGTLALSIAVLAQFGFNPVAIFDRVEAELGPEMVLPPPPEGFVSGIDVVSLNIALVFGTAGLPHILMRFLTVPDAKTARNSIIVATWIIGLFYLMTPIMGYGAALLVGQDVIAEQNPAGNTAAPQLAGELGGPIFLAFISAVAFATIVAVVAGLVIAASSAFAHDFYTNVIRGGEASEQEQFRAARIAAVAVSLGAMFLAIFARDFNVSFLVALAFAVAASANVPTILFTIFWRRFNTAGAIAGILTGLFSCIVLIILSPNILDVFPLANPAIISMPLGFAACYLGTILTGEAAEREMAEGKQISYDEIYVRANTGITRVEEELREAAAAEEPRTT